MEGSYWALTIWEAGTSLRIQPVGGRSRKEHELHDLVKPQCPSSIDLRLINHQPDDGPGLVVLTSCTAIAVESKVQRVNPL